MDRACSTGAASTVAVESKKMWDSPAGIPDLVEHPTRLSPLVDVPASPPAIHSASNAVDEVLLFACLAHHREVFLIEARNDVLQPIDGIMPYALLERLFVGRFSP